MKTRIIRWLLCTVAAFCLISITLTSESHAQYKYWRNRKPNAYFGIEGAMGTKTFSVKSDIPAINGMKALEEGFNVGLVAGGKVVLTKIKYGLFKPSSALKEKINLQNLELSLNVFPLEVFGAKNQFFKPYLIAAADRSQLKFIGNYSLPTPPPPLPPPGNPCPCICPGQEEVVPAPEPPPTTASRGEDLTEDTELGAVNVVRGSVGSGLIIHVPGKNKFINFFMEAQYGIPLSTRATSPAFDRTSVTGQLSLSAGLALGLTR